MDALALTATYHRKHGRLSAAEAAFKQVLELKRATADRSTRPPDAVPRPRAARARTYARAYARARARARAVTTTAVTTSNSVARHWAFTLVDMLVHGLTAPRHFDPILREDEKHRCGAGGAFGGRRPDDNSTNHCNGMCACRFDGYSPCGKPNA